MKILKSISLFLMVLLVISCDKHEIEYNTISDTGEAEFQLHYFVPITTGATNNIYKVEVNNQLLSNSSSPLVTYNAIPSGSVSRFFTIEPGNVDLKLYKGEQEELVYDQSTTLKAGKQNVFVYDFNQPPIVLDNGYPYRTPNLTDDTDSTAWVRFYNFLYEKEGVPTELKLQYQYIDTRTSELINLGKPVGFGEATEWSPVKVVKSIYNSSGYRNIYYRIKVIAEDGSVVGDLQLLNSSGKMVSYSDYWTAYIGRCYHHILGGMRTVKPVASIRQFGAL